MIDVGCNYIEAHICFKSDEKMDYTCDQQMTPGRLCVECLIKGEENDVILKKMMTF